eukprot:3940254-Rhodomonas_salina.4
MSVWRLYTPSSKPVLSFVLTHGVRWYQDTAVFVLTNRVWWYQDTAVLYGNGAQAEGSNSLCPTQCLGETGTETAYATIVQPRRCPGETGLIMPSKYAWWGEERVTWISPVSP